MPIKLITENEKGVLVPTPLEIIRKMIADYQKHLYPLANHQLRTRRPDVPKITDARSAWVSRKELEALLDDNNANGMRIYYGIHHDHTPSTEINSPWNNYGRHNVILVATIDNVDSKNPTTENSKDQLKQSPNIELANSVITSGEYEGMGDDQLPLCPPRCPDEEPLTSEAL
jgi:hypothetical protein